MCIASYEEDAFSGLTSVRICYEKTNSTKNEPRLYFTNKMNTKTKMKEQ